ncbi:MAG: FtsX-like permease family protein, partial [Bacteroidota bacterium]
KYLPNIENPIGELLTVDGGRKPGTYTITGIIETLPENTQYAFDFLMPINDLLKSQQYAESDGWGWNNFVTYIMTEPGANVEDISEKAINIRNDREKNEENNLKANIKFTPLNDLHLRDETKKGGVSNGTLSLFSLIAIFIIVIAWLNYINLATAQAMRRAKEVGIRKSIGALRNQLVFQFLTEAFIINFVALTLGVLLTYATIPALSEIVGKSIVYGENIQIQQWIIFLTLFLFGTLLSGFYPAVVLSRFRPAVVIKGTSGASQRKFGLRQTLVTVQLLIGIFLIAGTYTVYRQLQFMMSKDLGLNVNRVVTMRAKAPSPYDDEEKIRAQMKLFREKITSISEVSQASVSNAIPGGGFNWGTEMIVDGEQISEEKVIRMMMVDDHFHDTYEINLISGRFHDKDLQGEQHQIVVNETLIEKFQLGSPDEAIGKRLRAGNNTFPIVGVVEDFHWNSLKQEKASTILYYSDLGNYISVRLSSERIYETIKAMETNHKAIFPNHPFEYRFMDEYFAKQYESDRKFGKIFTIFCTIALFIACLGLFGLASFTIHLRVKEIGIRKVLGAQISSILMLIYRDYFMLIAVASILGIPIIYYIINEWLKEFAYRINVSLDLFLLPVIVLTIITFLTVSYQSIKAARVNPAQTIKNE